MRLGFSASLVGIGRGERRPHHRRCSALPSLPPWRGSSPATLPAWKPRAVPSNTSPAHITWLGEATPVHGHVLRKAATTAAMKAERLAGSRYAGSPAPAAAMRSRAVAPRTARSPATHAAQLLFRQPRLALGETHGAAIQPPRVTPTIVAGFLQQVATAKSDTAQVRKQRGSIRQSGCLITSIPVAAQASL